MQIAYVSDLGGDWEGVYVNGTLFYDGHAIPVDTWLKVLRLCSFEHVDISEWISDLELGGRYPGMLIDLLEELRPVD